MKERGRAGGREGEGEREKRKSGREGECGRWMGRRGKEGERESEDSKCVCKCVHER